MRYQLENGLTVILEVQRAAPVVALQVWVKAGSADETPAESGLAHLHEHMLFKGTARRGIGEIARAVESHGGEINAWTSFDQTVYHVVLASAFFDEGLDILSDAVRHSAFEAGELAREIEVVVEEIKRSLDLPSRRVSRAMFETAFQRHPYRLPVLGSEASVRSFDRPTVLAFYGKHYTPSNMVLVVVGDIDEPAARAAIERCFGGPWGNGAPRAPERAVEPAQQAPRFALAREQVKEAHLALAFHIPGVASPDLPALDLLAVVLGQGEGSRLNLGLKLEQALASDVYAYAYTPKDPGLLVAGATLPGEAVPDALRASVAELRRLQLEPLADAELQVAKAIIEADAVYGRETVQGVARKLGFYEAVAGRLEFEAEYYERVRKLTSEQVVDVARRYLVPARLTLAGLFPESVTVTDEQTRALIEESFAASPAPRPPRAEAPPAPAASARAARAPREKLAGNIETARLANGVSVLVKPERGVPLLALRAVSPGGLRYETEANNGVGQLYARLMTRATRRRSAAELAHAIDAMAGSLQSSAGRNSMGLRGEFLSKHFDRSLRLFAECLLQPSFAAEELERERSLLLQDIHARDDNPAGAVFDLFARTLYRSHPYRLDTLGEAASVRALDVEQLQQLERTAMHPANLSLCIVGDVEPDHAFGLAEELFGADGGARARPPHVLPEPPQAEPRRAFRLLDKAQAHLVYGFLGMTVSSPERHALDVLTSVLSGQGGRLFVELRDRRSLAYSVSSFSVEGLDPGYFGIYMGTSPEKVARALRGIRDELDKVLQSPMPEAEIDRARRYLIGAHAIGLQKNSARAAMIAYDAAYGIGADTYLRYEAQIEAITPELVLQVARRVLQPAHATLAILGPEAANVE